jgi:asparagine synthase (glutamine-hydrolysing)
MWRVTLGESKRTFRLKCPVHYVELRREPTEWFKLLEEVIFFNDEPIGSFSTVAHYLLMRQARELGITVILSGQGADELLCGYAKFLGFYLEELIRSGRWHAAARVLLGFWRRGTVISQFELSEAKRYVPGYLRPREIDVRGPALKECDHRLEMGLGREHLVGRQRADVYRFSVPALVHYEDRCSMAFGREIRLPFLDYRLVGMLLPADPAIKLRDGWTKWIFRKALEDYVPQPIIWRKDKQGFINPQSEWLKHELRATVEELLNGEMLIARCGLINQPALRRRYQDYCRQPLGRGIVCFKDIFNPIVLELWAKKFSANLALSGPSGAAQQ